MTHTTLTALFGEIANAIREKTGVSDTLLADDFPRLIRGMKVSGIYNQLAYSKDASGNIYNDCGWKTGYRLNSAGNEVTESGYEVTGFMPAKLNDVIALSNIYFKANESVCFLCLYDSNKSHIYAMSASNMKNNNWLITGTETLSNGEINITKMKLANTLNSTVNGYLSRTAYIRMCASMISNDSVITINE